MSGCVSVSVGCHISASVCMYHTEDMTKPGLLVCVQAVSLMLLSYTGCPLSGSSLRLLYITDLKFFACV